MIAMAMLGFLTTALSATAAPVPMCADLVSTRCQREFVERNMPKPTRPPEKSKAREDIQKALDLAAEAAKIEARLSRDIAVESELLASRESSLNPTRLLGDVKVQESRQRLALLLRQRQEQSNIKYMQRNEAVRHTIAAWGLTPGVTTAPDRSDVVLRPAKIQPWAPRYSERVKEENGHWRLLNLLERKELARKFGLPQGSEADVEGGTDKKTGLVAVFPEAFRDPDALAALIYHETSHWLDAAARGSVPFPGEHYMSEQRAYTRVADAAQTFKLAPDKVNLYRGLASAYGAQAANPIARTLSFGQIESQFPNWLPAFSYQGLGNPEPTKAGAADGFLRAWNDQAAPLVAAAEKNAEKSRREAEYRRSLETAPTDPYWEALDDWTAAACAYVAPAEYLRSDSTDPSYVAWLVQENDKRKQDKVLSDQVHRGYLQNHRVVVEKAELERMIRERRDDLSGCQRDMLRMISDAEGPLSTTWLMEQLDYRKGGGALGVIVRGIAGAISNASGAIAKGISAPFVAIGESLSSPPSAGKSEGRSRDERSRDREPRSEDRPSRVPDRLDTPAFNQLRGLAR